MRREVLISCLLAVSVVAAYWPVHSYPWVLLDDHAYVFQNPHVRDGLTTHGIAYAFTGVTVANWHPLTMLSHMLDCQLFGAGDDSAGAHHAVNLAIHAANTVLLFVALRRMTGAVWRSGLVAALFGLHPLHVESVAWISERKDVLSAFFFMLILLAYHHFAQRPTALRYAGVFLLLALGLMSKPMLVTVPFVLLLLDYWPLNRIRLRQAGEVPGEFPDEAAGESLHESLEESLHGDHDEVEEGLKGDDPDPRSAGGSEREETGREVDQITDSDGEIAPAADNATDDNATDDDATDDDDDGGGDDDDKEGDHAEGEVQDEPPVDWSGPQPLGRLIVEKIPLFVLVALSSLVTFVIQRLVGAMGMLAEPQPLWTRAGNAIFAYGQYLEKTFWPSPLAAVYPYVNRRPIDVLVVGIALAAISMAAVRLARIRPFVLVGWCWYLGTLVPVIGLVQVGMQAMADRYTYIPLIGIFIIVAWGSAEFTENWPAWGRAILAAAILVACGCMTRHQVATWSSSEALYRHAVEAVPYNFFAEHGLGMVYWKAGKLDEAEQQFEAALDTKADATTQIHGGREPFYRALGLLLAVRQQPRKALDLFDEAIVARPEQPEPPRHKAWILATSLDSSVRNGKKAVELAQQALDLSTRKPPEYWDTLAAAQAEAGNFKEAVANEQQALDKAEAAEADDLLPGIAERLNLFQSGRPYHAAAEFPKRF
jgi:Tfp pilus assembly protein PilF